MVTTATRIAYAQVDSFLSLLEQKYIDMIPRNIRYAIKQEKDQNYNTPLYADVPMKSQNLTDETLAIIAYLNLNYWCQDENEKEELRKKYQENEDKYNKELEKEKHGANDIFKNNEVEIKDEENDMENELVTYSKDNIIRKIILRLKYFFKIK